MIKFFAVFALLFFVIFAVPAQGQNCKNASARTGASPLCANLVHELTKVYNVRKIRGKITDANETPFQAVIEVYQLSKSERKSAAYDLTKGREPIGNYETNENGEFCLDNLPGGYYVLKVGAAL